MSLISKETLYIIIIIVIICFLVLSTVLDGYYVYINIAKSERIITDIQDDITKFSKAICEPIEEDRSTILGRIGTDMGIKYCQDIII